MLDRLKDIVPEVDENKANLIYRKRKIPKFIFSLNYKLALKVVAIIIVLVPVIVILGLNLGNSSQAPMPPTEEPNSGPQYEPEDTPTSSYYECFETSLSNGVLQLNFNDKHKQYYLMEYNGYSILSVTVNGEEVITNESFYCINSLSIVEIRFVEIITNEVLLYISTDNVNYETIKIIIEK